MNCLKFLLLGCFAALMFTSCQKEELTKEPVTEPILLEAASENYLLEGDTLGFTSEDAIKYVFKEFQIIDEPLDAEEDLSKDALSARSRCCNILGHEYYQATSPSSVGICHYAVAYKYRAQRGDILELDLVVRNNLGGIITGPITLRIQVRRRGVFCRTRLIKLAFPLVNRFGAAVSNMRIIRRGNICAEYEAGQFVECY